MNDRAWTGVVLSGGKSSRMGQDKALLPWKGSTLLEHAVDLLRPHAREILIIGDPVRHATAHATVIPDEQPGKGPLGGIVTALKAARYVRVLVVACDLPMLNDRLLLHLKRGLAGAVDAVIPEHDSFREPLAAAYHRHALDPFQDCLNADVLKMSSAIARVNAVPLALAPGQDGWPEDLFRNLNAPADL